LLFISTSLWNFQYPQASVAPFYKKNNNVAKDSKSSTVAEMGDRGHNRHGPKRGGLLYPFRAKLGPCLIQCGLGRGLHRTKWRLHPSSRLATIDMGQKLGGCGCALFLGVSWVPIEHKVTWAEAYLHTKWHHSLSCRLATTDIGRKLGVWEGGSRSPSNNVA